MQTKKIIGIALAASLVGSMAVISSASVSAAEALESDFDISAHTLGIVGSFDGWAADAAAMTDEDGDGVYMGVVEDIAAGSYEFKVRADGAWDVNWGEAGAESSQTFFGGNCKITTTELSDLVVVLDTNGEDGNVWPVCCFALDDNGGDSDNFNAAEHSFGVVGSFNEWGNDVNMTELTKGIYYATINNLQTGSDFKVRADGAWDNDWGAYNTEKGQTLKGDNCKIEEEANNVTIFLNTNGSDFQTWQVSFFYTAADGTIKYVNTNPETTPTDPSEESSEEPTESSTEPTESSEEPTESSEESSEGNYYETTKQDYIYFDNSQTKWDKVYAYWWNAELGETVNLFGQTYGGEWPGVEMTQIDGTDIYQILVPHGATKIIFSSGVSDDDIKAGMNGYQTSDLEFANDACAGKIYTIDASVEPTPGRGKYKTKFTYTEGAWLDYTGEFISEKLEIPSAENPESGTGENSENSTAPENSNGSSGNQNTPSTGDTNMMIVFFAISFAALGAVIVCTKKKSIN